MSRLRRWTVWVWFLLWPIWVIGGTKKEMTPKYLQCSRKIPVFIRHVWVVNREMTLLKGVLHMFILLWTEITWSGWLGQRIGPNSQRQLALVSFTRYVTVYCFHVTSLFSATNNCCHAFPSSMHYTVCRQTGRISHIKNCHFIKPSMLWWTTHTLM